MWARKGMKIFGKYKQIGKCKWQKKEQKPMFVQFWKDGSMQGILEQIPWNKLSRFWGACSHNQNRDSHDLGSGQKGACVFHPGGNKAAWEDDGRRLEDNCGWGQRGSGRACLGKTHRPLALIGPLIRCLRWLSTVSSSSLWLSWNYIYTLFSVFCFSQVLRESSIDRRMGQPQHTLLKHRAMHDRQTGNQFFYFFFCKSKIRNKSEKISTPAVRKTSFFS